MPHTPDKQTAISYVITMALLLGAMIAGGVVSRRIPQPLTEPLDSIGADILGWKQVRDHDLPPYSLRALKPTSYLVRTYHKGPQDLDVFIAFYAQQRSGESMHSPKHCLPGGGWEIWNLDSALIPADGGAVRVNKYSIQNSGRRMLMFYWYQSKDRIVADEYMAKVLLARDTLLTGHTAGSIVRITLPDTPQGNADGVAFASRLIGEVNRCFGRRQSVTAGFRSGGLFPDMWHFVQDGHSGL